MFFPISSQLLLEKTRNLFEYQAPATKPHARKDTINVWSITSTLCIPHITSIHLLVYWSVFEDLDSLYQPQSYALFLKLNSLRIYHIFHFMIPRIISKKKYDDASQTGVMINYQPKQCTIFRGNPLTNLPSQAFLSNLISPKKMVYPFPDLSNHSKKTTRCTTSNPTRVPKTTPGCSLVFQTCILCPLDVF